MLPSFISNLFWNSEPLKEEEKELEEDAEGTKAVAEETKAVAEESGDWLIISCKGVSSGQSVFTAEIIIIHTLFFCL